MACAAPDVTFSKVDDTSTMISQVIQLHTDYNTIKDCDKKKLCIRKIKIDFVCHVQTEEDIGVKNKKETTRIIDKIHQDEKSPSQEEIHEELEREFGSVSSKMEMETYNLYVAYKHLRALQNDVDKKEQFECFCLIDVDEFITGVHDVLMNDLTDEPKPKRVKSTPAGKFSTAIRKTTYNGETFFYPHFTEEGFANASLQHLVDKYNDDVKKYKDMIGKPKKPTKESLSLLFETAAKFLFVFLYLHPFSDGNGRLGRLLCCYLLQLFCPFPSPIYNVYSETERSDYVKILVEMRNLLKKNGGEEIKSENDGKKLVNELYECDPKPLCELILDSNRYTWRKLISMLHEE